MCKYKTGLREPLIHFIKAGGETGSKNNIPNVISIAPNWQLIMDLKKKKQLKFANRIVQITFCPELLVYLNSTKKLIIWELLVAWEENITLANERKHEKYQELVERCQQNGWKTYFDPIEIGCRGFVGHSLSKALAKIGIIGATKKESTERKIICNPL